jgi:hypothetical protein
MCTKRRSNVGGCYPDSGNPFLHGLGDELRVIVGTNVLRDATQEEEIRGDVNDIDGFQLLVDSGGSTANQRMTSPATRRTSAKHTIIDRLAPNHVVQGLSRRTQKQTFAQETASATKHLRHNCLQYCAPSARHQLMGSGLGGVLWPRVESDGCAWRCFMERVEHKFRQSKALRRHP